MLVCGPFVQVESYLDAIEKLPDDSGVNASYDTQKFFPFVNASFPDDPFGGEPQESCHRWKRALKQTGLTSEGNMERVPFEDWAFSEIARLKDEAESLALVLKRYLNAVGKTVSNEDAKLSRSEHVQNVQKPHVVAQDEKPSQRRSKYDGLIAAFVEKSGDLGLTMDAMVNIRDEQKVDITRDQLRSLIFAQKSHGKVYKRDDFYIWNKYHDAYNTECSTYQEKSQENLHLENAVRDEPNLEQHD